PPIRLADAALGRAARAPARNLLRGDSLPDPGARSALAPDWLRAPGNPVRPRRKSREGPVVRLPHVRELHSVAYRHVVPDELPQAVAQRAMRRGPARRYLRSDAGHALCLGRRMGGSAAHAPGRVGHDRRAEAGRPFPPRQISLAYPSAGDAEPWCILTRPYL